MGRLLPRRRTADVAAREHAYRLYRERGQNRAARVAAWLASDCLEFRDAPAVANGWLQRAHRLLADLEPDADHGRLALHEGAIALGLRGHGGRPLIAS